MMATPMKTLEFHAFSNNPVNVIYKQQLPFGAEICSDISLLAKSVPRSEQFEL